MAARFQATALVGAPSYPDAVAWSDDNLIAVASGHLVTILNPGLPLGPRGLITVLSGEPFPIGVVDKSELLSPSLIPICLGRDSRPCVRSISWSPLGLAPNSGCLLAVCTTEGRVKIYRPPFCDFATEWIEVMDISTNLCHYLESISFGESEVFLSNGIIKEKEIPPKPASRKEYKRRKTNLANIAETEIALNENSSEKIVSSSSSAASKPQKEIPVKSRIGLIGAEKYSARSSMASSLVVAWSPVLQLSPSVCPIPQNSSSISLLAVGSKSGEVSLWRVSVPEFYSIEQSHVATTSILVGVVEAHTSWVTAVSWELLEPDSSNPLVLLVTGSSDGSVKIWMAYSEQLLKSEEPNHASFCLLKEVVTVDIVPVSVISLTVPAQSSDKMLLAVGKGSGTFEVLMCDILNCKFDQVGSYDAHDNIVTGLAWAFNGRCLYSCSQDNSVRSWILCDGVLSEAPIPSNTPRLKSSIDLSDVFVSCLGLAVSPGNLVIAMVRNFDEDLLDPMYQRRTQKAAVEFFWIGAQEVSVSSTDSLPFDISGFPIKELVSWEVNVLWSLKQFESLDKPLVLWDIVAALSAFKRSATEFVEHILVKWLSTSSIESRKNLPSKNGLSHVSKNFSEISSRKLHLLNVICRRLALSDHKAEQINLKLQNSEEKLEMWMEFLSRSERELRERLVFLSLASSEVSCQSRNWVMQRSASLNHSPVKDRLRVLASEVQKHEERLRTNENEEAEQCCYCSASVPFDSPETAYCRNVDHRHKLARCAVSMRLCLTGPTWFCVCCHRQVSKLAPEALFVITKYPDFDSLTGSSVAKPLCPFCGILLQRLQPDFLLSSSPV